MANKLYEEDAIQAIADAIRLKNGATTKYTVADMAGAVQNIPTSSGGGGTDTSDATLTNGEYMLSPYTAYGPTGKITGLMANNDSADGTISTKSGSVTIHPGYTSGGTVSISQTEINKITSGNIRSGVSILGTLGTYTGSGGSSGGGLPAGVAAIATGSYTPTSDMSAQVNITHGLDATPDQIIIWTEDINWVSAAGAYFLGSFTILNVSNGANGTLTNKNYAVRGTVSGVPSVARTTSYGVISVPDTTKFTVGGGVVGTAPLKGGCEYKWMVIKYAS